MAAVILGTGTFGHPAMWRADPNGGGQWAIGAYARCVESIDSSGNTNVGNTIVGNTVGNTVGNPDGSGNTFGNTVAFNTIGNTSGPWTNGENNGYRPAQIWCCTVSGGQWGDAQAKCVAPPA